MREFVIAAAAAGLLTTTLAFAGDGPSANLTPSGLSIVNTAGEQNGVLTVVGPNGYYERTFAATTNGLATAASAAQLADGTYNFEYVAATSETIPYSDNGLDDGRGPNKPKFMKKGAVVSGSFTVSGGQIVQDAVEK